jgi:Reverse transcriptase (RNA-dependent DNA polymerase)
MSQFGKHDVLSVVSRHLNNVLLTRWELAIMKTLTGDLSKACFVICRNTRTEGCDHDKTFSPMHFEDLLCLLLAVASQKIHCCHQLDAQAAFPFGFIDREIFVELPAYIFPENERKSSSA